MEWVESILFLSLYIIYYSHPSTLKAQQKMEEEDDTELLKRYQETGGSGIDHTKIGERQDSYHQRQINRRLSPERGDMFADKTPSRGYAEIMKEEQAKNEYEETLKKIDEIEKKKDEDNRNALKRKWEEPPPPSSSDSSSSAKKSKWSDETPVASMATNAATPVSSRWDATPVNTPAGITPGRMSRWNTPTPMSSSSVGSESSKRSRWDETPAGQTPVAAPDDITPLLATESTTRLADTSVTAEVAAHVRYNRELQLRNRPLTDDELDSLLPSGYQILIPPKGYVEKNTPSRALLSTPTPYNSTPGFFMQNSTTPLPFGGSELMNSLGTPTDPSLPEIKPEDIQFFGKLFTSEKEENMTTEEAIERKILQLLLKIKNGTPLQRKGALRQISDRAREYGAKAIFDNILPILMSQTLEDQERHLMVKVIDRVLYQLEDLVRPYVHKILVVIEPMLIDEDYYARIEGREIISNLAKAAGLATMISTMRPEIDSQDEYLYIIIIIIAVQLR